MSVAGFVLCWLLLGEPGAAAGPFLDSLDPVERKAAGLDELSPEQLRALEAAVARHLARSSRPGPEEPAHPRVEPVPASGAAVVQVQPGTAVTYVRAESTLRHAFTGWKRGTVFVLENGQSWRVIDGAYWARAEPPGKQVTLEPGAFGAAYLRFEGIGTRAKVERVQPDPRGEADGARR